MLTNEQIQRKIAEVLGWTGLKIHTDQHFTGDFDHWLIGSPPNRKDICRLPNWSADRNAIYDLLHKMNAEDTRNATDGVQEHYRFILETHPAIYECLIYLWHEGWRWVDCDSCEGEPHGVSEDCTDCNGDGGEWVKA